jgi:hypothetical protein
VFSERFRRAWRRSVARFRPRTARGTRPSGTRAPNRDRPPAGVVRMPRRRRRESLRLLRQEAVDPRRPHGRSRRSSFSWARWAPAVVYAEACPSQELVHWVGAVESRVPASGLGHRTLLIGWLDRGPVAQRDRAALRDLRDDRPADSPGGRLSPPEENLVADPDPCRYRTVGRRLNTWILGLVGSAGALPARSHRLEGSRPAVSRPVGGLSGR